ncbi:MAG: helix-turn-helix transcriptional regulator [Verrucomicrobiia bacterium]
MENPVFQRLRQFQVSEGLTWCQVAKKLNVSVSMLMMVKRGKRNPSAKTLYRLERFEREATERKSRAERVVEGLLAEEGTAAQLIERELGKLTRLDFNVDYSSGRVARTRPKEVTLWKPPDEGCGKLRQLFAQTMDTAVIVLACLPNSLRSEKYLAQLTADSRIRLTNGALNLVIPDWRSLVAGKVTVSKEAK